MVFLSPIWLFAASAILVPIAIHLWNKRQGKTVKVGSLRWLEPSASRRWSSIKLSDVWLLVLRCCILIFLAVALAEPVWEGGTGAKQPDKAVYIGPEVLHSTALGSIKPTVDALLQRGYTLHRYDADFSAIPAEQWQALSSNTTDTIVSSGNHWALLPALAQRYSHTQDSVWLFTSDQQRHFAGTPAPLQENIQWIPVALEASSTWLQAAYATSPDSILFVLGHSTREGTTFRRTRVSANSQGIDLNGLQVRLVPQSDSLWATWGSSEQERVLVRKQPLQIGIAHGKAQQAEVRYLQAAFEAISDYTGIPITARTIPAAAQPDTASDWLFWLSDEDVPQPWLQQVKEQGAHLWIQPATEPAPTTARFASAGNSIKLHQLTDASPISDDHSSLWRTSDGTSLLTVQPMGQGSVYYFLSGFSPAWSQLGQSAQLPELLLPLLLPQQVASRYDARALDEEQLKPTVQPVREQETQEEQPYSLMPWVVLLAFLLFLAERLITGKRAKV